MEIIKSHFSQKDIDEMEWEIFEAKVVDAVKFLYSKHDIKVIGTKTHKDGGRDAESQYVLAVGLGDELEVNIKILMEVKKRGSSNVNKKDIGSHLIDAYRNRATKIIFITNRKFTSTLDQWLSEFCGSVNMQYSLVPGDLLLDWMNAAHDDSSSVKEAFARITKNKATSSSKSIILEPSFTLDPTDSNNFSACCHARADRPVFMRLGINVSDSAQAFHGTIRVEPSSLDFCDVYPLTAQSKSFKSVFMPGDRQYWTFAIWPKLSGEWGADNFDFVLDGATEKLTVKSNNSFRVSERGLKVCRIARQDNVYNDLSRCFQSWLKNRETSYSMLRSHGGMGKSYLLAGLRQQWHQNGIPELVLDGENILSDTDLVVRAFKNLFPFANNQLGMDMEKPFKDWLEGLGISKETAGYLAHDICCAGKIDNNGYDTQARIDVFYSMLVEGSIRKGLVVVIEDLHKVSPSVLHLLHETIKKLHSTGRNNIFFFLTSRPYMEECSETVHAKWSESLSELLALSYLPVFDITPFDKNDACELLLATIPTFEISHCKNIITQVGASPFLIRESVLYLYQKEIIKKVRPDKDYILIDPVELKVLIDNKMFHGITTRRLKVFFSVQDDVVRLIMEAGSCIGRQFNLTNLIDSLSLTHSKLELSELLGECAKWSFMAPSPAGNNLFEFDHDLVRIGVLDLLETSKHRVIAEQLFDGNASEGNILLSAALAYQAGLADQAYKLSIMAAKKCGHHGQPADAISAHKIALLTLNPPMLKQVPEVTGQGLDSAIEKAAACQLLLNDWREQDRLVLGVLTANLGYLDQVSSGSSKASGQIISESRILCERLGDKHSEAALIAAEGRMHFEQDNLGKAVQCHAQAEEMYNQLDLSRSKDRAANLIRYAICLRQFGSLEQSIATLLSALKYREGSDWKLLNKVRNNIGAVYLRSDWDLVRYHWGKQVSSARRHKLHDRVAHGLASLSFVNIFSGRVKEGIAQSEEALLISKANSLDNTTVRCNLNLGAAFLIEGNPAAAQCFLIEAEELALKHGIGRRLWRVFANLAVTYELMGDMEKSFTRDLQTINSLKAEKWSADSFRKKGKKMFPLLNIALREKESGINEDSPLIPLPDDLKGIIFDMCDQIIKGNHGCLGSMHHNYLVDFDGRLRFLLTE